MYKIILTIMIALLFSGCFSTKEPMPVKANEKAFAEEDAYILFALRAEQIGEFETASTMFNTLWERSGKKEYLYKSLKDDLVLKKNKTVISRVDNITNGEIDDFELVRLKVVALMSYGDFESARVLAIKLVDSSKEVDDYILVSEIYVKQKKYDTALKYLESAYIKDYNEMIQDKMAIILYVNLNRTTDAIAQLETHTRINGCSQKICQRLVGFYSNENNADGLLSVYLRMHELDKNDKIAQKIIQIYVYQKDYIKLMSFLQNSGSDDDLLLQIYVNTKNYAAAYVLAQKLYESTDEINYLGQSAIFEYESSSNKDDKKMQKVVIKKLKTVVSVEQIPLYLNYLGYLLIDHSIDVKLGMHYVREALKFNKNSAFYLDSLAWGYYKLGECSKAKKVITEVQKLDGGDDPEVLKHVKAIDKCKNKKTKR